jgi:hypothetical protein
MYRTIWKMLSETLVDYYILTLAKRNAWFESTVWDHKIEHTPYVVCVRLGKIKKNRKKIYQGIKAEIKANDAGYRYIARDSLSRLGVEKPLRKDVNRGDTAHFWALMDKTVSSMF